MTSIEAELNLVGDFLFGSPRLRAQSELGMCRSWVGLATGELRKKLKIPGAVVQIREIHPEPYLEHTFIRVCIPQAGINYIFDGVGISRHPPVCGLEENIPHLQGSHPDMLNPYLSFST
ncbi:hypothetical protein KJ909_02730 [Patescibacteria group bacterium]|nr:hypothetical protein [Patescibacteria group bacterium]